MQDQGTEATSDLGRIVHKSSVAKDKSQNRHMADLPSFEPKSQDCLSGIRHVGGAKLNLAVDLAFQVDQPT